MPISGRSFASSSCLSKKIQAEDHVPSTHGDSTWGMMNDTWRSWYHVFVVEYDITTWYMMIHGDTSLYVIIHDDTAWSDHTWYMMVSWFRLFCSQFQEQVLKRCIAEVAMALLEQSSNLSVWQVDRQTLPPKIVELLFQISCNHATWDKMPQPCYLLLGVPLVTSR